MIEIAALRKRFGRLQVLDGIDLAIRPGRVTAIVGPNGSGKTTLIKMILGLAYPDEGSITVGGARVDGDAAYRARIGYMPQIARFPENLTGGEVLHMLEDLRGASGGALDEELRALFRLDEHLRKPIRTLSGGTRQKLNALAAFLFRPDLLILDEPSAGLDPVASSLLKDKILRERAAGRTFILTSHIMSELEELSDDIVFLLEGKIRFTGTINDLKSRTGQHRLERAVAQLMTQGVAA